MIRKRLTITAVAAAILPATALFLASPAYGQAKDNAPINLPGSAEMMQDKKGSESWTYVNPEANFTRYRTVIVDNGSVYQGPDAQFDGVDPADRDQYAVIMTDALRTELAKSFVTPAAPQADTIRLKLVLIGVDKTKGGVATATRVTPIGFGLSAVKSVFGKGGTFSGSVLFAVEGYDGVSGVLLFSGVRRRTPDALDIPSTISTTDTVKAVARDFAENAAKKLQNMTGMAPAP